MHTIRRTEWRASICVNMFQARFHCFAVLNPFFHLSLSLSVVLPLFLSISVT